MGFSFFNRRNAANIDMARLWLDEARRLLDDAVGSGRMKTAQRVKIAVLAAYHAGEAAGLLKAVGAQNTDLAATARRLFVEARDATEAWSKR